MVPYCEQFVTVAYVFNRMRPGLYKSELFRARRSESNLGGARYVRDCRNRWKAV